MSANSTTKTEAKSISPYGNYNSTIDDKIFYWYRQDETEIGYKSDDKIK